MPNADDLIKAFQELPAAEQAKAGIAIHQAVQPLPAAPANVVGTLWLMVVGAFVALLVGGTFLLYLLTNDGKTTDVIFPLVSGSLGVLAGLLAPSPVAK